MHAHVKGEKVGFSSGIYIVWTGLQRAALLSREAPDSVILRIMPSLLAPHLRPGVQLDHVPIPAALRGDVALMTIRGEQ